jgi:hypothetical protein
VPGPAVRPCSMLPIACADIASDARLTLGKWVNGVTELRPSELQVSMELKSDHIVVTICLCVYAVAFMPANIEGAPAVANEL